MTRVVTNPRRLSEGLVASGRRHHKTTDGGGEKSVFSVHLVSEPRQTVPMETPAPRDL